MNGHDPEHPILPPMSGAGRARDLFERSVSGLDLATGNRLRLLRRGLVAEPQRPVWRWLLPAGVSATAALLLGLAWWLPARAPPTPVAASAAVPAAGEALLEADDDAELYAWLGEAPVAVATGRGAAL